jgi:hypothetical protein
MFEIWVFCGGKCGGTTLAKTFTKNNFNCIHLHGFNCKGIFSCDLDIDMTKIFEIIEDSCKNYENIFIIDVYRTPIERKISGFFQNITNNLPNYKELTTEEIINYFNSNYLYDIENYHPINNILTHYNIPLFKYFEFEKGYNIIKKDNKIFIKILFRDIDKWDKILTTIFNKNITIYSDNLTYNKNINTLYSDFKKKYRVPINYVNNILINDNEFKIYNTVDEQNEYIEKWSQKSC